MVKLANRPGKVDDPFIHAQTIQIFRVHVCLQFSHISESPPNYTIIFKLLRLPVIGFEGFCVDGVVVVTLGCVSAIISGSLIAVAGG